MHTPRLCIDGRTNRKHFSSVIAEEIINQLVASRGDPEAGNEWVEKGRTVLLTHPDQVYEGQWRRYNTKIPASPIYWAWERSFVRGASLSVFHRFRSSDRLGLGLPCTGITTVLSPGSIPKLFQWSSHRQLFVVPSDQDRHRLSKSHRLSLDQIHVVRPSIRRFCLFAPKAENVPRNEALVIHDGTSRYRNVLSSLLAERMPSLSFRSLRCSRRANFEPEIWLESLSKAAIVFYLVEAPFDWATPALEALYWGIPTVFQDENGALSEILGHTPLELSRFLVDRTPMEDLISATEKVRGNLLEGGAFHPLGYARQFKKIYDSLHSDEGRSI